MNEMDKSYWRITVTDRETGDFYNVSLPSSQANELMRDIKINSIDADKEKFLPKMVLHIPLQKVLETPEQE